jgi:hypothetical protein
VAGGLHGIGKGLEGGTGLAHRFVQAIRKGGGLPVPAPGIRGEDLKAQLQRVNLFLGGGGEFTGGALEFMPLRERGQYEKGQETLKGILHASEKQENPPKNIARTEKTAADLMEEMRP